MSKVSIRNIRTIALVGQAGSGKTSLAEALLAAAGAIPAAGSIERGTTVCDYLPIEHQLRHSLKLAVATFEAENTRIHLLDTPGYPDFVGHALPALSAVETAAIVINAQNGIELMTRRMMQAAERMGVDRIIVVNRIDAEHVDLPGLLMRIRETFGRECLPINLPAGAATRVSDCFFSPGGESDFSSVEQAHRELVDQVVEVDEKLMALYLEKGEIAPEQLHETFERALREGHLIPVVFTSSKTGAGIAELLQVIVRLLPNPTEGNPPRYLSTGNGVSRTLDAVPDPGRHVLAHVFKVEIDPFIGRVVVFRVHQGRVTPNMQLYAGDGRKPFKPGHLWLLRGKQQFALDEALPGDICAVSKVEELRFHQVLHDAADDAHIHAQPLDFPASVFGLTLLPKKRGDEQKLSDVLHRFLAEDPCFRLERDPQANETVIRGLGELHLKTLLDRMVTQHRLEVDTRPPSIPFRETIAAKAQGHARHKKQSGGAGQFGEVFLRVEPLPRGGGFEFVDEVKGGVIPSAFIPAVEKGVRAVLESGFLAGYPIQDLRVTVYDGKHHPVDSQEVAFVSAGRKAFIDALARARAIVLEPVVNVEVVVPDARIGEVSGDLGSRRGHLRGTDLIRPGVSRISAQVPLPELENFSVRLKLLTSGEGAYTLDFSHYEPAPAQLQRRLVSAYKPAEEAE
ncbi:MAG: elongation factor G [Betaproteobacteria bacterium]|nr:elongation factor G [Betaproteobacteria bacterium]